MDIEHIGTLLNNTAYPIVAFILMYRLVTTTLKENTAAMYELLNWLKQDHQ